MKKILINGSPRSGTTFVGVLMEEYTKDGYAPIFGQL